MAQIATPVQPLHEIITEIVGDLRTLTTQVNDLEHQRAVNVATLTRHGLGGFLANISVAQREDMILVAAAQIAAERERRS